MNIEMILVVASFTLQAMLTIIGTLIWHEFKRLQNKVDTLTTHRMDCMNIFAGKESHQRLWNKIDDQEKRICRLEGTQHGKK